MSENPNITFPKDPIGPPIYIPGIPTVASTVTEVHFAYNIPDLIVTERTADIQVSVAINDTTIMDSMTLTPDENQQITIPARQFARIIAPIARPESTTVPLPKIRIGINFSAFVKTTYIYPVIPGGIAARQEMFDYLLANFLTAQPQILETTPDQPQWLAFVRTQTENETVTETEIRSVLHAADGRTFTKTIGSRPDVNTYNQIDTSFGALWREFCREKVIVPVAYDVFGESVVSRDGVTTTERNRPLGQRYLLRPARYNDRCFGFVNSMGGFDTLMMQGSNVLKPEGETTTFFNNESEKELSNDYTSYWEASTGYIDTERMAAQYQDFLKSCGRWVYSCGVWRRIIVDEYKLEHTPRELNAYTFKYHLAERNEYRNVERTELPDVKLPIII